MTTQPESRRDDKPDDQDPDQSRPPLSRAWMVLFLLPLISMLIGTFIYAGHRAFRVMSDHTACVRNQSLIFSALMAYQDGGDPGWPNARWKFAKTPLLKSAIPTGADCARFTAGIFEILCVVKRDSPERHFQCPSAKSNGRRSPDPTLRPSLSRLDTSWGWGVGKVNYAMDWTAPPGAGTTRVLLGDRDDTNHPGGAIVLCYADGHTTTVKAIPATPMPGVNRSVGYDDGHVPGAVIREPVEEGEPPDDLYDDAGDALPGRPDSTRMPNQGHPRRAVLW